MKLKRALQSIHDVTDHLVERVNEIQDYVGYENGQSNSDHVRTHLSLISSVSEKKNSPVASSRKSISRPGLDSNFSETNPFSGEESSGASNAAAGVTSSSREDDRRDRNSPQRSRTASGSVNWEVEKLRRANAAQADMIGRLENKIDLIVSTLNPNQKAQLQFAESQIGKQQSCIGPLVVSPHTMTSGSSDKDKEGELDSILDKITFGLFPKGMGL